MKDKIIMLIIGILIGAVIATGAFYVYSNSKTCNNMSNQMNGEQPPQMPNGSMPELPNNNQENNN